MKDLIKAALAGTLLLASQPLAAQTVYFEDNFDGEDLLEEWEISNPDPDGYLVEGGVLIMLTPDKVPSRIGTALNVLRLNKPIPKGDWTMTARIKMTPQSMGESVRIGVSKDESNAMLASLFLNAYNYALTNTFVATEKIAKGESTWFSRSVFDIENRDLEIRSRQFTDAISAFEVRLKKKGRSYIGAVRLEPTDPAAENAVTTEWLTVQKLTSLRSPGNAFTLIFGSNSNDYTPNDGEALIEIDWVRIETP